MKVVLLAGGLGTRLSEETETRPKPMVDVGGRPLLWHIMKHYAHHGFTDFYVALGYKGDVVKRYFLDYAAMNGRLTVTLANGGAQVHEKAEEDWTIDLVDTGGDTQTGGRVKRLAPFLEQGTFMVTYGDGVSDIDLSALLAFHRSQGKIATLTAVRPPARFGGLVIRGDTVVEFTEKPQIGEGWINGGFLVLEPAILDRLGGDEVSLEAHTMDHLAREGQLAAFRHEGFWQCVDTLRELRLLQSLWAAGSPPWKVWQ
jgi:glucose-1-phosphate cytidylyltransferase